MGVADYGTGSDPQNAPSLAAWAASVSAALDGDDTTVDARVAAAVSAHEADTTNVHGIADTAALETTGHAAKHAAAGADPVTLAQSQVTSLVSDLALKAPLASPTFTGTVTVPTPAAGSETTVAANTAWAAERARVGNLLTANQASVETDLTGFTASASTLARAAGSAMIGSYGLEVTCTAANGGFTAYGSTTTGTMPVVAGQVYTFRVSVKAASITRAVTARIYWWQSNGTSAASTASNSSSAVTLSTSEQMVDITAVAPANAAYASLYVFAASSAAAEVYSVDKVGFWAGAGGDWAMPGVPITNLGRRVTHPNVDDVLVQNWDASLGRWQTVHYDSGWRDVSALFTPGAGLTSLSANIRRVNMQVDWLLRWNQDATAPTTMTGTIPVGFRFAASLTDFTEVFWSPSGVRLGSFSTTSGGSTVSLFPVASQNVRAAFSHSIRATADMAIPTTLPGTLVSAAPA